jgi:hypothetical protein
MNTSTVKVLVAGIAVATMVGCADSDDPTIIPEATVVAFVEPESSQVLTALDDADTSTDGLQFDVQVNVTSNQEGAELELSIEGIDGSVRSYAITGQEVAETISFEGYTLPEGDVTLIAIATYEGEEVARDEITVQVNTFIDPGPTASVEIVSPSDGTVFGASDDEDPGAPGFQTTISATTLNLPNDTEFTLSLNDSLAGTAVVVDGSLVFEGVTLSEGNTTIGVFTELSDVLTVSDSVSVTVETGACEVELEPAPEDTCAFNVESTDEDADTDGFQTTFTVNTDCAEVELLVGGDAVATATAVDGVATFEGVTLNDGETDIQAIARTGDQEGASPELTYVSDFSVPVISVDPSLVGGTITTLDDVDPDTEGLQWSAFGPVSEESTVTVSIGDTDGILATIADNIWTSDPFTFPADGSYEVTATAVDTCGNTGVSEPVTVSVASEADDIAIEAPVTGDILGLGDDADPDAAGLQTSFSVTSTLDEGASIRIDCTPEGGSAAEAGTGTAAADGAATISVTLVEGNLSCVAVSADDATVVSQAVTLEVDITAPTVSILAPAADAVLTSLTTELSVLVGNILSDDEVDVAWTLDAGTPNEVTLVDFGFLETVTFPAEGTYSIGVGAVDRAGNAAAGVVEVTVVIDAEPPVLTAIAPVTGATLDESSVTVTAGGLLIDATVGIDSCDGVTEVCAAANSLAPVCLPCAAEVTFEGLAVTPGANTITYSATDDFDNNASLGVSFTVDVALPSLVITTPVDGAVLNTAVVEVAAQTDLAEGTSVELLVDESVVNTGLVVAGGGISFAGVTLNPGVNALQVRGTDARGLGSSPTVRVTLDTVAPVLSFVDPIDGATFTRESADGSGAPGFQIDVSLAWEDDTTIATANLNVACGEGSIDVEGVIGDGSLSFSGVTLTDDGSCVLTASVTDAAGNPGSASATVSVDRVAPVIDSIVVTSDGDDNGFLNIDEIGEGTGDRPATVTVNVTGIEDGQTVEVLSNNPTIDTVVGTATFSGGVAVVSVSLAQGAHTLSARTVDASGNATETSPTVSTTVDTIAPVVALTQPTAAVLNLSNDASASLAGLQFAVAATSDGPDGSVVSVSSSVDSGPVQTLGDISIAGGAGSAQFTLPQGQQVLTATATDAAGNVGESTRSVRVDSERPVTESIVLANDTNSDGFINLGEDLNAATPNADVRAVLTFSGVENGRPAILNRVGSVTPLGSGTVSSNTATVNFSIAEGTYELFVGVADTAENSAIQSAPRLTFTVDLTPPTLAFADPLAADEIRRSDDVDSTTPGIQYVVQIATDLPNGSTVTLTADPDGAGPSSLGSLTVTGGVASGTVTVPLGEAVVLSASAADAAGNQSTRSVTVGVSDVIECDVAFADVTGGIALNAASDENAGLAGIQVSFGLTTSNPECNGLTTKVYVDGTPYAATMTDGVATVVATFPADGAGTFFGELAAPPDGAISSTTTFTYIADSTPPVIVSLGGVSAGSGTRIVLNTLNRTGGTWPLIASITGGNGGTADTSLAGTPYTATISADSASFVGVTAADGTYSVTLVATDASGNTDTESFNVTIDATAPNLSAATFALNRRSGAGEFSVPTASDGDRYELYVGSAPAVDWTAAASMTDFYSAFTSPGLPSVIDFVIPEAPVFGGNNYGAIRATDINGNSSERVFPAARYGFLTRDISVALTDIRHVAALGDINSDGFDDFAVGGFNGAPGPTTSSAIIIYGAATVAGATQQALPAPVGSQNFGVFPNRVGDVNGDGVNDLLVSASQLAATDTLSEAFLFLGNTTAGQPISNTPVTRISLTATAFAGGVTSFSTYSLHGWGNVWQRTGDPAGGLDDLVIGAGGVDTSINAAVESDGILFVIAGRTSWPSTIALSTDPTANAPSLVQTILPTVRAQRMGRQTGVMTDSNADGFDELVSFSGAGGTSGATQGRILVWRGIGAAGTLATPDRVYSPSNAASAGNTYSLNGVDTNGDVNGDGLTDALALDFGNTSSSLNRVDMVFGAAALPASGQVPRNAVISPDTTSRAGNVMSSVGNVRRDIDSPLAGPDFTDLLVRIRERATTTAPQRILLVRNLGAAPFYGTADNVEIFSDATWSASAVSSGALFDADGFTDFFVSATSVPAGSSLLRLFY